MNEAMSEAAGNLDALLPHLLAQSLMAVGGIYVVLAELHRVVVQSGMMSDREFTDLFALAQAAPGPNSMFIALLEILILQRIHQRGCLAIETVTRGDQRAKSSTTHRKNQDGE